MTTSLADLLDLTCGHARGLAPTAGTSADVASAMSHYGTALARCSIDDPAHPGHGHAEDLAAACRRFAAGTQQREQRLGHLAGATADTIAVLQPEMTTAGRWAVTVAIADTASELVTLVNGASALRHLAAETTLRHLHCRIGDTQRLAAAHPPNRASQAILDRPIPATFPLESPFQTPRVLANAVAGIVHHTRPGQRLALCEVLAVTIAMESLTETTARLLATVDTDAPDQHAATAWRAGQHQLRPFNDGTRRRQTDAPPLARYALDLYLALPRRIEPTTAEQLVAIRDTLHHAPLISRNLITTVQRWADTNALLGYACDMPTGARHVTAYLAGHHAHGLIPADEFELRSAMISTADAATATEELAAGLTSAIGSVGSRHRISRLNSSDMHEPLADMAPAAPSRPL